MGKERSWKGKYVLLCIACCVNLLLWLSGCVYPVKQWQGEQALKEAKGLMGTGEYSASEKKTLGVLEAFPQTLGDEALFQMGLLYSLPNNPNADYEKSKVFFEKLLKLHPDSGRKEEAAAWLSALHRIVGDEKETVELQRKMKLLEQSSESRGKKLKQLQEELEERERKINEQRDAVGQLKVRVTELESHVTELESQLAKFKSIDLTIEQKKRATAP